MNLNSFPCLVCGKQLVCENDSYIAQPVDGVMCSTSGNYGSTVYDPMDGTSLAFNICDDCMLLKRDAGRFFESRHAFPVKVRHGGQYPVSIWGWKRAESDFEVWTGEEREFECVVLTLDETEAVADDPDYRWNAGTPDRLREWIRWHREEAAKDDHD